MALSGFVYFVIFTVIVQASPIIKKDSVHDKLDELLERTQILLNATKNNIENELQLDNYISLIVNTTVKIKKEAKKNIIDDVDKMVYIINTVVDAADEEGIDVSGCVGDSINIIESSGEDLKKYITLYTGEESDNGIQEMDNYMGLCNRQISSINLCLLNIQKCKLEEGDVQSECYEDLAIKVSALESDVPKKITEIQTNSVQYYDTFEKDMSSHVNANLTDFYRANLHIVQAILDCIDNMFTTTVTQPPTTETITTETTTVTQPPTTETVTTETTTVTQPPTTETVTTETTTVTQPPTTETVTTETTTVSQPPTTETVTTETTTVSQPPTTETVTTETTTVTQPPTTVTVTTETTTVTQPPTTERPTTTKTPKTTTTKRPSPTTPKYPPSDDQICLYEILTDLSLRFALPIVKNEINDEIDALLARGQMLLKTTKNKIDNELQLDIFITEIVDTAVLIKKNAHEKIDENIDKMVSGINTIIIAAYEKGVNVKYCIGNNSSTANIILSGDDLKKYVTLYTGQASDEGIQEMDNYKTACNRQISTINVCLINIQKCKLEEGNEQIECYNDLSIKLSVLELDVPKNINEIQTSSSIFYNNLVRDMNDHINTILNSFYTANLQICLLFKQ